MHIKTQKEIVTALLSLQLNCLKRMDTLSSVDITMDLMGDMELWNIALDIIGFPEDNSLEFDFDFMNRNSPDGKRTDYDNMFCRDWLLDPFLNEEEEHSVDLKEYVEWLYDEFYKLSIGDKATQEISHMKRSQLN